MTTWEEVSTGKDVELISSLQLLLSWGSELSFFFTFKLE